MSTSVNIKGVLALLPSTMPEAIIFTLLLCLLIKKLYNKKIHKSIIIAILFLFVIRKYTGVGEIISVFPFTLNYQLTNEYYIVYASSKPDIMEIDGVSNFNFDMYQIKNQDTYFMLDNKFFHLDLKSGEKIEIGKDEFSGDLISFYRGHMEYHWYFIPFIGELHEAIFSE